ncbi:MAG: quinol dehydrogenase ferredoxin subunit NapH [Gammaproteobacteria bacterium]|nr:quinol dehydrogenase ferredoxin subunit NapH [Gammaproteobacteria bacterium]MCP5199028.1 quinol dehydrogenase ferredoxin subunit NapH [Gammaproteobacteria bacterium]
MSAPTSSEPATAPVTRPWWLRQRWLLLRRASQFGLLGLFMLGPWAGIWWAKGNLAASTWFDLVPLSDPFIVLQSWLAVGAVTSTALLGAGLIAGFYWLVGGRVFCSWVCPVNVITDAAHWLRTRLRLPPGWRPQRSLRLWLAAMCLVAATLTGSLVWELVNPVTLVQRALVFGVGAGWTVMLAVFLFDLLVSRRGWCGHLCPVGAFYGLLGTASPLRVAAHAREACTDCGDCFEVCPEPQVISPALRGSGTRIVVSGDCTNCGRCIDVCPDDVFRFAQRYRYRPPG